MVREIGGDALDVGSRGELERLAHAAVQHAPAAERQAVVGGVAQQPVAEREDAVVPGHEEALEALEHGVGLGVAEIQRRHQLGAREADADHRGLPQTPRSALASSSICSAIKPSTDSGSVSWSAPSRMARDHLGDEQRAAVRALGDRRCDVRGQRRVIGQLHDEQCAADCSSGASGTSRLDALGRDESVAARGAATTSSQRRPGAGGDVAEQCRRCLVHELRVVDDDQRRVGDEALEQRLDSRRDALGDEAFLEAAVSGVAGRTSPTTRPSRGNHGSRAGMRW